MSPTHFVYNIRHQHRCNLLYKWWFFSFIIGLSIWLLVSAILQWPLCWYPNWHFKETSYCCRIEKTIELWSWRRALHRYIQTNCKCDKHSTSSIHLRTFQVKMWHFSVTVKDLTEGLKLWTRFLSANTEKHFRVSLKQIQARLEQVEL